MEYEWDVAKSQSNVRKHGCAFDLVEDFDWSEAIEVLGPMGARLFALAFAPRGDNRVRVISLRPATQKEKKAYVKAKE